MFEDYTFGELTRIARELFYGTASYDFSLADVLDELKVRATESGV